MRHSNYYNQYNHKLLNQYYFFLEPGKISFKKYPVLKQRNRHTRLFLKKKHNLKRFLYSTMKYKRDTRRL